MEAVVLREFGPAENLRLELVPDPEPGQGQVRIAVAASGVHLVDTSVRSGRPFGPGGLPEVPYIPGREVAGTVDRLGEDVDEAWLGARVAVSLGNPNGGYARFAVAPATGLLPVDPALGAPEAIAMAGTGRTAFGVLEAARLTAGDVVLVTAAAGGLGTFLVQSARRVGARVIGLAGGPEKTALAAALGAELAVDYRQPDWQAKVRAHLGGAGATVLLDGVGGDIARGSVELLGRGGRALFFGFSSGAPAAFTDAELAERDITTRMTLGPAGGFTPENLRRWAGEALAAAAAGQLKPQVETFPLAQAAVAHARLEGRLTTGKVVLV
ncbi:zinc-binding dehydrogenase [Rhodococcus maanshanensis]|uniref:NADPH2:quinone reductase n=1 Tax=Rhodococcus maanshanensis TaxID=183556 RepID=A0A1H7QRM7_9NOCA|nr:zinc-binding dehydrogenase [Rhodococcus maanshanensis]SEL50394.1 NADPH2:quinone reductase [Rhodococcus maanshanensis]